ncbi:MAG: HYR domain-containing protein, partial [Saprospiraceae bacterium]|nr:HYR domain-containing protein [Saprospiraceae bacterium]
MMYALTRKVRMNFVPAVVGLCFINIVFFFPAEGVARTWDEEIHIQNDTTRVPCNNASSAYSSWINTLRLQIQVPAEAMGDSVSIEPAPPPFYNFMGPCGDTISLVFNVFDSDGNLKTNQRFVFLAFDNEPPQFSTTLGDTIYLTCFDPIPAADNVQITDCLLNETSFSETVESIGNCPLEQKILRRWTAEDECGLTSSFTQVIFIRDDDAPSFLDFPADTLVDCTSPTDFLTLGAPMAEDVCDANPSVNFFDQIINNAESTCTNRFTILRNWLATDECGNTRTKVQRIIVRDDIPPVFTVPRDTIISCAFGDDPFFTGQPSDVSDNCDSLTDQNIRFEDLIVSDSCDNIYSIERTWFVFDNCGNTASRVQRIDVIDEGGLSFSTLPQDLILDCTAGLDPELAYLTWIGNRAGAVATDNCTPPEALVYEVIDSATGQNAMFPAPSCLDGNSFVYEQTVLITVTDDCNQSITGTVHFRVMDTEAPRILNCPSDTILATNLGRCDAEFLLPAPQFEEACDVAINYQYRVGDNPLVNVSSIGPAAFRVPQGTTLVTYYLADCAGNTDSCSFYITVMDQEPPVIDCP